MQKQMKRTHIFYSGGVQGVGFRFTAIDIANSLNLTGWAKNLTDGRVEVICEGEEADINNFIERLEKEFSGYIRDKQISWSEATDKFKDFSIVF